MDPLTWIAIIIAIFGGAGVKGIEKYLAREQVVIIIETYLTGFDESDRVLLHKPPVEPVED